MPRPSHSRALRQRKEWFRSRAAMNSHLGASAVVSSTAALVSASARSSSVMPGRQKLSNFI